MADTPSAFSRSARLLLSYATNGDVERARPAGSDRAHPLPASQTQAESQRLTAETLMQQSREANRRLATKSAIPGVVPEPIQELMQENKAPQATEVPMFAPGAPLPAVPELESPEGPRQWQYPVGYNIAAQPRSSESTSFAQLRNLALLYEGIQLCETVYFDILSRLVPVLKFKPNVVPVGESDQDPQWRAIIDPAEKFLHSPDGEHSLHAWLTASARDVLELGWSSIYKQRDRSGKLISLDLVDTATIKPLLDQRGRRPKPPFPAYAQYIYGIPAGRYRADEIHMVQESARSDSIYPFSRVERIIMRINMALRKEALDLSRFTDGSVPEGMIFPDAHTNWTPAQTEEYERVFNGLLSGNDRYRVRVKFGPPGAKFVNTRPSDPMMEFDSYLLNVTVAVFGLTMDEIAMTQDSNRSVGQTQQDVIYRRVIEPLANRYAHFLTGVVQEMFDSRLVVTWGGIDESEDRLIKAQVLQKGVESGAIPPDRMAELMGWPVSVRTPPFVMGKDNIIFLDDALQIRDSQREAAIATNEFTAKQPEAAVSKGGFGPGNNQNQAAQGKTGAGAAKPTPKASAQKAGAGPSRNMNVTLVDTRGVTMSTGFVGYDLNKPAQVIQPAVANTLACQCGTDCDCKQSGSCTPPCPCDCGSKTDDARRADYRRWRKVALSAVGSGRSIPRFQSHVIPREDYALLSMELAHCSTADEVRAAFLRARAREQG